MPRKLIIYIVLILLIVLGTAVVAADSLQQDTVVPQSASNPQQPIPYCYQNCNYEQAPANPMSF